MFVILTGLTGTGKSTIIAQLRQAIPGTSTVVTSQIIRDELEALGQEITAYTVRRHAEARRQQHGPDYWMRQIVSKYNNTADVIYIDGARNVYDLHFLINSGIKHYIIGVTAEMETCIQRTAQRQRDLESTMSIKQIRSHLEEEYEPAPDWGMQVQACLTLAHTTIDGNDDPAGIRRQLDPIISAIRLLLTTSATAP